VPALNGQKDLDPLTSVMPRDLLEQCISVYFQYVYGLVPLVHRPTFLADFHGHRERHPDQEEWTVLVLSVAGMTVAHVPWAFSSLTKEETRGMVRKCHERAKAFLFDNFDAPTFGRCKLELGRAEPGTS
jgi:hypothetical protein